jgi:hypothetical protein
VPRLRESAQSVKRFELLVYSEHRDRPWESGAGTTAITLKALFVTGGFYDLEVEV